MHEHVQAIILAAGNSSRLNTGRNKLLEKICGQALIIYPTKTLQQLALPISLVVGYQKELLQETIVQGLGNSIQCITQPIQRGTADALLVTRDSWYKEHILIMHADIPLITTDTLKQLYNNHLDKNADVSFVSAHNEDPALNGYDRVITHDQTVEIAPAIATQAHEDCCINAGIYLVKRAFLETAIERIQEHTPSLECSFSSIIKYAYHEQALVQSIPAAFDEVRGVNTLQDLWAVEHIKRSEIISYWMMQGVHFPNAHTVQVDNDVTIDAGSSIGAGVHLLGATKVGANTKICEFSSIENSIVGNETTIFSHTIIKDSCIGNNAKIGPFAHIKEQSSIGNQSVIGNFVEIKKSSIAEQCKAKHLSYIGDAQIGTQVNIGAGTITCNHNGVTKNKTIIEDNAYIGASSTLVAPVTIGSKSFTAAGSVITQDVPENALAIARARQVNKEGYAQKMRERTSTPKDVEQPSGTAFVGAIKTKNDTPTSS